MKWKRILKIYGIALAVITASLLATPAFVQAISPEQIFPSSKPEIAYHLEPVDQIWQRSGDDTVNFVLDAGALKGAFGVEITCYWEINESVPRIIESVWEIYSNGIYVKNITYSMRNLKTGHGGEYFDINLLPAETLKLGENMVKITWRINSTASEIPTRPNKFHFIVTDINVREIREDADLDGIYNRFDLVENVGNLQLSIILMVLLFPPLTATGIERKKQ